MADIATYLEQVLEAQYGKDVRQAIHDAIEACYTDGRTGATDLTARAEVNALKTRVSALETKDIFPVGSVYLALAGVDPNNIFTGTTWELKSEGNYLMSAGGTYAVGSTGGYIPKNSRAETSTQLGLDSTSSFDGRVLVTKQDPNNVTAINDYRPSYLAVNVWVRTA